MLVVLKVMGGRCCAGTGAPASTGTGVGLMSSATFWHCVAKAAFCFIALCTEGCPFERACLPGRPREGELGKDPQCESKVPPELSPRMVIEPWKALWLRLTPIRPGSRAAALVLNRYRACAHRRQSDDPDVGAARGRNVADSFDYGIGRPEGIGVNGRACL